MAGVAKKTSSGRWQRRQARDPFVRRAQAEGWRSRAAFKLIEIDARERLLRRGAIVVDLGAAPGGWSQVAAQRVAPTGRVIAVDRLPMAPLPGVEVIQADLGEGGAVETIRAVLGHERADLVLSDMAPNISGVWSVDQPRSVRLAEIVLDAAGQLLRPGGALVLKVFQGEGFDELVKSLRARFGQVRTRKPSASRTESREMYLVAGSYRL
jgi:23S rRNA (uridine2552-2'-O)-methyltransferase